MFFAQVIAAVLLALLVTAIFGIGFRRTGPWSSMLAFFIVLFLTIWAAGMWLVPVGPVLWGLYWVPFVAVAFIIGLILAASVGMEERKGSKVETAHTVREEEKARENQMAAFDLFFWGLTALLIIVILFGYILNY